MAKVSVVMPVYNVNLQVLEFAVESILNQTYTDFELIICDDCSDEHIFAGLQAICERDHRIVLLRNSTNLKAGGARNKCIECAKGKYIAMMDADDYSCKERLEKQVAFLEAHSEYAFVGSRARYFERDTTEDGEYYWFCEFPQKKDFLFTLPFLHASVMFCAQALQAVNGYSQEQRAYRCEDYDLLMRLYVAGYIGVNLRDVLYLYRVDRETYQRRQYRYRLNEVFVKLLGFHRMRLMPRGIPYALKPLIVGLIPQTILKKIKRRYYRNK